MVVFVHGNPETSAIWDAVRDRIDRPSKAVSLPGFGAPRSAAFGATKDEYVAWLVDELDAIDGPVDLVGHDWGALLMYRIVTAFGEGVRSWVGDVANIMHPEYVWHDFAQIWQTPGHGEGYFEKLNATPAEDAAGAYEHFGVPYDEAVRMAGWMDELMGRSILDLYRSATPNLHADWGSEFGVTQADGLVLHPTDDSFSDAARSREVAEMLGAAFRTLEGVGHWWPLQDPAQGAQVLMEFWRSL